MLGGESPGFTDKQSPICRDGLSASENVVEGRDLRSLGMAPLLGLLQLVEIPEQGQSASGLSDGKDIRQRHLRRLVDDHDIGGSLHCGAAARCKSR